MPHCGPTTTLILPDPVLAGRANVSTFPQQDGQFPGPVSPRAGNQGRLVPIQSGTLPSPTVSAAVDVLYRLTTAGGPGTAEFAWQDSTGVVFPDLMGKDDVRRLWGFHPPFASTVTGESAAVAYSSVFRRALVFVADSTVVTANGTGRVFIRYRDVDTTRFDSWTQTTFDPTFETRSFLASGLEAMRAEHALAVEELDDGALLMALMTTADRTDLWRSEDGGLTWVLLRRGLTWTFPGGGVGTFNRDGPVRLKRSGDWLRLCITSTDVSPTILTRVSSDRGATWTQLADFTGADAAVNADGSGDFTVAYDLVGLGDSAGTFILAWRSSTLAPASEIRHTDATQDNAWRATTVSDRYQLTGDLRIRSVTLVRTPQHVYEWLWVRRTSPAYDDNFIVRRVAQSDALSNVLVGGDVIWQRVDTVTLFRGCRFDPVSVHAVQAGPHVLFHAQLEDFVAGNVREQRSCAWLQGGPWTRRPLGRRGAAATLPTTTDSQRHWADVMWAAMIGRAAPVGNADVDADSPWTESLVAGGAVSSYTVERIRFSTGANGDVARHQYSEGTPGGFGWAWETLVSEGGGLLVYAFVRLPAGSPAVATGSTVGLQIRSRRTSADPSNRIHVQVRVGATEVRLRDVDNATDLITLSGLTVASGDTLGTAFTELRLHAVRTSTAPDTITYTLAVLTHSFGTVNTVASGTATQTVFTSEAGAALERVEFGNITHDTGAVTVTSDWREVVIVHTRQDYRVRAYAAAADVLGEVCAPAEVYVSTGLTTLWGGVQGGVADQYDGRIAHSYAVESALTDSPRVFWRDAGPGPSVQSMVFDADPTNGQRRWEHTAVALFGLSEPEVLVAYDDDSAFGSPAVATTLATYAWGPLRVSATDGNYLDFNADPGGLHPRVGEAAGLFARVSTGAAGASSGRKWQVTRHVSQFRLHFGTQATSLVAQGLAVGATFFLWADAGVVYFAAPNTRYMRLRYSHELTSDAGRHRCGHIVAGTSHVLTVPLDWGHQNAEEPVATRYRSRSGLTWAFQEGPPDRRITGRLVGDVDGFRDELRALVDNTLSYVVRPLALLLDSSAWSTTAYVGGTVAPARRPPLLVRWAGASRHDDAGWSERTGDLLRTAGDVALEFERVT